MWPGVRAAFARSRRARIACGVVGAARRDGIGRVAGPPRGVLPVPGVRTSGVRTSGVFLLPGVGAGPALAALWKGVLGGKRAFGVVVAIFSGDKRSFFRADSDMAGAIVGAEWAMRLLIATGETRRWDAPSLRPGWS